MGNKPSLTPEEVLCAAYAHYIMGIDQHAVATVLGVSNSGRVAEACKAMHWAMHNHMALYRAHFQQNAQTNAPAMVEPSAPPLLPTNPEGK